ncbi:MAG: tRNA (adenosine(37)-N6)-dimethylallyltransferase MiaA, partial [Chloroflexi bacterium]|nr:tRNA (adenosine(37)-N6)-dimethylallyltransferase MiaA [Chloroflexota bacterium]
MDGSDSAARPTVVFIVGATASGKTAAALALATRTQTEVVNADSRQVYRGMSIGTAKPTPDELAAVPHHLIDVADPADGYSLAAFLAQARDAIDRTLRAGAHPVVVGGSGQYVWGLAEGWRAPSVPPQTELRAELEREAEERGADALHARLAAVDAEAAAAIDARNVRRVVRALEVWEVTGATFSSQRRKERPPFEPRLFGIDVPRAELHARIDARVDAMMERGWLAEVQALLDAGVKGPIAELVVDDRIFDRQYVHPTWPVQQLNRWYCAEVAGVNFHTNLLLIYTEPQAPGDAPLLRINPQADWIHIKNRATSVIRGNHTVWAARALVKNEITVHGDVRWSPNP